jgi:hypothetical protein
MNGEVGWPFVVAILNLMAASVKEDAFERLGKEVDGD